jgi:2-dehydro-3-deoxyphosphogluconate aldolase/(4S)-4-hydroxy-2-oxoglutarate aldolase
MPSAENLIQSLRSQPLLIVLRPGEPLQAVPTLERLHALGVVHVEIAWQPRQGWADQMAQLIEAFPALELGAASLCDLQGLIDASSAGCRYAVSPVLDPQLQQRASALDLLLVPGVMTASEVHQARKLGCAMVKLFPAVSVGREHWRRLRQPLGFPLPFCIAAGGLRPADVLPWLAAGVDAVALGSGLGDLEAESEWRELLDLITAGRTRSGYGESVRAGWAAEPSTLEVFPAEPAAAKAGRGRRCRVGSDPARDSGLDPYA